MKYAVDKIEGDIVVLDNISSNNIKYSIEQTILNNRGIPLDEIEHYLNTTP